MQKFRQSAIASRNQVFCLKIWKLWQAPTILQVNSFCWNFSHVFYLPMFTKGCVGFFLYYLDLELFAKIKKDLVSTLVFCTFINNSRCKQNKKNPTHPFVDITSRKRVQNFSKNIKLCGSWSSPKFWIFQIKNLVSWKWQRSALI